MRGGGGVLIRDLKKPSRPDIYKKKIHLTTLFYHFILTSLVHGWDGDNETAEVSRGWSLIRDLTEPFRPHILSVLRFLQCFDVLLCCDKVLSMGQMGWNYPAGWVLSGGGGVGFRFDLRGAADKSFLHYIDDLISVRWFISMGLMGWNLMSQAPRLIGTYI